MVERLILIRLTDSSDAARGLARAALQTALRAHPGSARCGLPADAEAARSWDLAVIAASGPDATLVADVEAALGDRISVLKSWAFSW